MKLKYLIPALAGAIVVLLLWANRTGQPVKTEPNSGLPSTGTSVSGQASGAAADSVRMRARSARLAPLAVFQPLPYTPAPKDTTELESRRLFRAAMISYQRGNYQFASHLMPRATSLDTTDTEIALYAGIVAGINRQFDRSTRVLSVALRQNDLGDRAEQLRWYLAQSYLATGEDSTGVAVLRELSRSSGPYATEARDLLLRIDTLK